MKFYQLTDGEEFPNAEWDDEAIEIESIVCPVNPGHQRASERLSDLTIKLPSSRIGDFIWTWYSECIITEKVANLFKKAGFTGYILKPVVVSKVYKYHKEKDIAFIEGKPVGITKVTRDRSPKPIPSLWELKVIGKGGNIHPDSGISVRVKEICPACGLEKVSICGKGIILDESQWDGSDFFAFTEFPGMICIVERVKELIIKECLTNCKLIPSDEIEFHFFPE